MDFADLSLTSIKLCSPVVIFIVYVILSGISLFMTRNTLKKFKNQKMENLYNIYSWSEVKLVIVLGVVLHGLCQYEQMNLAWIYLMLPVIYIMVKNIFIFWYVSLAHQNAPKDIDLTELLSEEVSGPASGANILPNPPIVKSEVDTSIFGMRGDPLVEGNQNQIPNNSIPPTQATSIDQIENYTGGGTLGYDSGITPPTQGGVDGFFGSLTA
jgi:hypothetical protein